MISNAGVDIHTTRAFEIPVTDGAILHDILTVWLNDDSGFDHVVNATGTAVNATNQDTNIDTIP